MNDTKTLDRPSRLETAAKLWTWLHVVLYGGGILWLLTR